VRQAPSAQRMADPRRSARRGGDLVITQDPGSEPARALPLSPALRVQQAQLLRRRLSAHLSGEVQITITDNRAVMISVQRDPRHTRYLVRLHHLFIDAPTPVLRALARYVAFNDRFASRELNAYIDERQARIRSEGTPRATIRTAGRVHDLRELFDELNARYFDGLVTCRITWGRHAGRGRPRRSIKVGSYSLEEHLIRIHPGLDQAWIPRGYLSWVVYHEMLHAFIPPPVVNGRHCFHTESFAEAEKRFADFDLALAWERRNLAALLCI
jgi:hypothetical protein